MLVGKVIDEFELDGERVKIRYPEMNDARELRDYINELIDESVGIPKQEKVGYEEELGWLADSLKKIKNDEKVQLVLEIDGEIIGSSNVAKKDHDTIKHVGELGISLNKRYRGKGLGTKLMELLISESKEKLGIEILEVDVFKGNSPAKKLYNKFGFEKVGEIEDYVKKDGEYKDRVIMAKDLRDGEN